MKRAGCIRARMAAFLALVAVCGTFAIRPSFAATTKSIHGWVACDGKTDDSVGVQRAFSAAAHGAFTLLVDCPVRLHIGMDIARTIFVDDDTTVVFSGAGKITVDNQFHPAFVFPNSKNIKFIDWVVEYDASLPVDQNIGGYTQDGAFVASKNFAQPAAAFNDLILTPWLTAHRGIKFDRSKGYARAFWVGPTNACAIFLFSGDTSDVTISGMRVSVPKNAGVERFIPVVFALDINYKSNQTVTANMPLQGQYFAVVHDIRFSNIVLDGTYMGWVGGAINAVFENIQSHRYGDMQDGEGQNGGGIGKWFAPPHLFYFIYSPAVDPALFNRNIQIKNVVDDGPRVGTARDKGGADSVSGYALSLKLGCVDCSVDTYSSNRPDGFMDVLPSDGMTISNVVATFDTSFINHLFPGLRFPSASYKKVMFKNINLTDLASDPQRLPIGDATQAGNEGISFKDVHVSLAQWSGKGTPLPTIYGPGNDVNLDYSIGDGASRIVRSQKGDIQATLQAVPSKVRVGGSTLLTWSYKGATQCTPSGAWSGPISIQGSRTITLNQAGTQEFSLHCQNASDSTSASLKVDVGQ